MNQENTSKKVSILNWKVILAAIAILVMGTLAFVFIIGNSTKQKLVNGRWKLVYMEADDAFSKRVFEKSQQHTEPDFFIVDFDKVTTVTFLPDTLVIGCKIKAKAIESIDGQPVFRIIELTEDKLELEQMIFNHGGPFGPYRVFGSGKKLSFINMNKQPFQAKTMEVATETVVTQSAANTSAPTLDIQTQRKLDRIFNEARGSKAEPIVETTTRKSKKVKYTFVTCFAIWGDPLDKYGLSGHSNYVSDVIQVNNSSADNLAMIRDNAESQIRSKLYGKEQLKLFTTLEELYNSYEQASDAMHGKLMGDFTQAFHIDGYYHSVE